MTTPEISMLVDVLMGLYPTWKPTDEQSAQWRRRLAPLSYDRSRKAVQKMADESRRSSPLMREFLDALEIDADARTFAHPPDNPEGHTRVYIQCEVPPPKYPGRAGWFIELCYPDRTRQSPNPDEVLRIAVDRADKHQRMYGGAWRVVQQSSLSEMLELRGQLRAQYKPPAPQYVKPELPAF